jgi:O-antigen/teichoic acid export membrane protein
MLKKALLVVSGNAFGSLLSLVRNLLIARLISPENYGIASTFAISMSIVEMLSYLGLNQLMVVDKDGDDPHFQAAMQGFQVMRGTFSSIVLFLIAQPYAAFLGVEEVAWAYQVIALIPLINGLQHYDPHRLKRHMNFRPTVMANALPPLASVLSVWPLAMIFGDYRIMLVALFVQAVAMVALSHLTAERPYRLALDRGLMARAVRFGWPLLLNGMLMFFVFNGERLIVGRELGMGQLAFFSMCFTLTLTPTLVLANSCQTFFLPQLSAATERTEDFQRLSVATMETSLVIAMLLVLGGSLVGGPLAYLLVGPKYLAILGILVPMSVVQALRVAKTGSSVVALSKGLSGNAMIGNLMRVASLPLSWWVAIRTGEVMPILWIAMAAELLGYALSMVLAARRTGVRLGPLALPAGLSGFTCMVALFDASYHPPQPELWAHLHTAQIAVAASGLAALWSMGSLRRYVAARLGA